MPLHIPDAKVQSLNLSQDKDMKPSTVMSNYSMTLQEKEYAERNVTQLLLQKSEINEWSVADVSRWLESSGLTNNAQGLQEAFLQEQVDGPTLLNLTDE